MEIQQIKKIKVFSTQSNTNTIVESTASTWGELKNQVTGFGPGMKAVLMNTVTKERMSLDFDENKIPDNAAIFLMPAEKNKSGLDLSTLKYNELRRLAKDQNVSEGLGSSPTRDQLIKAIRSTVNNVVSEKSTITEKKEAVKETQSKVEEAKKPTDFKTEILRMKKLMFDEIEGLRSVQINIDSQAVNIFTEVQYLSQEEFDKAVKQETNSTEMTDEELFNEFNKIRG